MGRSRWSACRRRTRTATRIVSYEADEKEDYDPPYLILDTRPREEFAVNRIHRAKSFPAAYLCRDYLLPEMHQFVRAPLRL
jgi:centrosomal protein CEP41